MITPRGTRLYIEAVEQKESKLASGIFVPKGWEAAAESIRAKVLAIGPAVKDIKVGDELFVAQFAPTKVQEDPMKQTFTVPAEDVLAVIK